MSQPNFVHKIIGSIFRIGHLFFWRFGTVGVSLVSSVLLTHFLTKEQYGYYQLILSITLIVGLFCLRGLSDSTTIAAAKKFDGNLRKIGRLFFLAGCVGAIAIVVASLYYVKGNVSAYGPFLIAAFFMPFEQLKVFVNSWLSGRGLLDLLFCLGFIEVFVWLCIILFCAVIGAHSIGILLFLKFILSAAIALFVIRLMRQHSSNVLEDPASIQYGIHASIANAFGGLVYFDKVLVGAFLSIEEVAVYSVALLFPEQIRLVQGVFTQLLTPGLYKAGTIEEGWAYLKPRFMKLCVLFALIGVLGFFLIPLFVNLFLPSTYSRAANYGKWIWLVWAVGSPITYISNLLRAQQKLKYTYIIFIAYPVATLLLYFAFSSFGLEGFTIARILSYVISFGITLICFNYYLLFQKRVL